MVMNRDKRAYGSEISCFPRTRKSSIITHADHIRPAGPKKVSVENEFQSELDLLIWVGHHTS